MSGPRRVMIIRHAEKPLSDADPHLSPLGRARAYDLVNLFSRGGRLAGAQFLFAADRSKHSNRCIETLQPLALALGLRLNTEFDDDEWKELAKRLLSGKKYQDAVILCCWHHGSIPALAKALGVWAAALPMKKWPDDCFDQVWVIDFHPPGMIAIRAEGQ